MPVVTTTAPRGDPVSIQIDAGDAALLHGQSFDRALDDLEIGRRGDRRLHRRAIELAVGLSARAAHGRAFGAIEQPKLDSGGVGDAAHEAVERIDLADELPLAQPADRRIAGHGADRRRGHG